MAFQDDKFQRRLMNERDANYINGSFLLRLDSVCDKLLNRLDDGIATMPMNMVAVTTGIMMDKRRELEAAMQQTMAVKQSITLHGLSRNDAMALASGQAVTRGDGDSSPHSVTVTLTETRTTTGPTPAIASQVPQNGQSAA